MTDPAVESRFDADAFLTWEAQQPEKHEYVGGEAFAMVGARREHVVVSGNFFAAFKERLRGGACQAYVSDLKLRVEAADAFFYPDVMVSCDRGDQSATLFVTHPRPSIAATSLPRTEASTRCRNTCWWTSLRGGWRFSDARQSGTGCSTSIWRGAATACSRRWASPFPSMRFSRTSIPPQKPPVWMTGNPREGDPHVPALGGGSEIVPDGCTHRKPRPLPRGAARVRGLDRDPHRGRTNPTQWIG